jgi:hypothetical protein
MDLVTGKSSLINLMQDDSNDVKMSMKYYDLLQKQWFSTSFVIDGTLCKTHEDTPNKFQSNVF